MTNNHIIHKLEELSIKFKDNFDPEIIEYGFLDSEILELIEYLLSMPIEERIQYKNLVDDMKSMLKRIIDYLSAQANDLINKNRMLNYHNQATLAYSKINQLKKS